MPFSFTLFEPKHRKPKQAVPVVEVKSSGRIMFNKQASSLLGNNHFCALGYDPENKAVGILPLAKVEVNCLPVRYTAKGAYIGAKKALRFFGILPQTDLQDQPIQNGQYIAIKV